MTAAPPEPRFAFDTASAPAGDVASVRLTTSGKPRTQALRRPIRVYLVPKDAASAVRTRFDRRLHSIGELTRRSGGRLRFTVPPLDSGSYVAAAWCPECAGRSFFKNPSRFRLNVQMPPATESCPVTAGGRYGNGLLATVLPPDGIGRGQRRPEGLFAKLGWDALTSFGGSPVVRGERLDGPGQMQFVRANRGGAVWAGLYGWMTPVYFSSEGCWRIAARVDDVTLSYVVRVVASP